MKRKEVKVTLSPNEEAQLIREEQERRRILRIQQVREQQRNIAQRVRQKVERRRQQEVELLAEELRAQWEQQQKERVDHLQRLYQESLSLLGQGHRNAQENEPDLSAADQKAENDSKAEERYRKALKELKQQRLKNQENQSRSADARRKALAAERIRAAKVASLPLPPAQPLQENISKSHVVKKCDASSFAATHYHMPETLVEKETPTSQPSACVEAEQEVQRMTLMQRQEEQKREEQQEKARLRGREALRREQLLQDRGRLLVELEHLQQTDLLRRRQQVGDMPRQIFEPLYKRQETQLDLQRVMEFAFEDMYSGERRVKGDLLCHLVPEPLPPPSTDSLCQDLDVTQEELTTSEQDQSERHQAEQDQAVSDRLKPKSVDDFQHPKASDEGPAVPQRRGLKKLLTRIQTQRQRWSESEVVSTDSPCGQNSSIDTGLLTTADKQSKEDVELSAAVAVKTQELEEQRRREEELEREKREQMEILEQLEQRKLKLEERLNEAQRERALLRTSTAITEPTDTALKPVAENHTRTMEEQRLRLLQQKELHQKLVEVARERLEEYQRALRIRYNMPTVPTSAPPPAAVPPATVPSALLPSTVPPPFIRPPAFLPVAVPSPVSSALQPSAVPPSSVHSNTVSLPTFLPVAVHPSIVPSALPPSAVLPPSVVSTSVHPSTSLPVPITTSFALRPSAVPPPSVPPPAFLPVSVPTTVSSALRPSAVPSLSVLPTSVHPPAFLPVTVPPSTVPSALRPSAFPPLSVPRSTFLQAAGTPSVMIPPSAVPPAAVPLSAITHSSGHLLHLGHPRNDEQAPVPTETVSTDTGPLRPHSALGSDNLTVLRHKAFLKFVQDRLGVTKNDQETNVPCTDRAGHPCSQRSPPVSMAAGPSVLSVSASTAAAPCSISSPVISAASGPKQVVSDRVGSNTVVSTVAGQNAMVTMATCSSPDMSTRIGAGHSQVVPTAAGSSRFGSIRPGPGSVLSAVDSPGHFLPTGVCPDPVLSIETDATRLVSTGIHPDCPVSRGVGVGRDRKGSGSSGLSRERLELLDNQSMIVQPQQDIEAPPLDKQPPQQTEQEQVRSNLLQALLKALERSNMETSQHADSDQNSFSGSSTSSGSPSVCSSSPSAAPKPPVSRARLGCMGTVLHQLSVIEEVNTPASVSLLTGEDTVTAEEFQGCKVTDSSASPSCSLSDFAQFMDSPQSLEFESRADYSGSSAVSSYRHPTEPDSKPQPSLSSTISTGSYITTEPELLSRPDSEQVTVETLGSTTLQSGQNHERLLDQGTAPQTHQFAPVETVEALPTEEPSVLHSVDSFRPLMGQISDQSMSLGVEDITLGTEENPCADVVAPGLELLVGHPSAHSSVIGKLPDFSPLMAWDCTVKEGLSDVPTGTWQCTLQEFVPTEEALENESSADASSNSGFHQLHAEVTLNQTETTESLDHPAHVKLWSPEQMRAELSSPEQMRAEEPSCHVGLLQWSPPELLICPSLKDSVEGVGILEQSQITLASLTDGSSDEKEPEVDEEQTGAQCHKICSAEMVVEDMRSSSPHSLNDLGLAPEQKMNTRTCDHSLAQKLLRTQEFHKKTLQRLRAKENLH